MHTLPAASKPSINIRTSWSLLQRTSDEREVKRDENERPMTCGDRGERESERKKGRDERELPSASRACDQIGPRDSHHAVCS